MNDIKTFVEVVGEIISSNIAITKKLLERIDELEEHQGEEDKIKKLQSYLYNLQGQINELDLSLEELRGDIKKSRYDEELKIQINNLQKRLNELETSEDAKKPKMDEIKKNIENLKESNELKIEELKKEIENKIKSIEDTNNSLKEEEINKLRAEIEELKNNISKSLTKNIETRINKIEEKLKSQESEVLDYISKMKKLDEELEGEGKIEKGVASKIKYLLFDHDKLESEIESLKESLKETKDKMEFVDLKVLERISPKIEEELSNLKEELTSKQNSIYNYIENMKKLDEELGKEERVDKKLLDKIKYLLAENSENEANISGLKEKIKTIEDKMEFVDLKAMERMGPQIEDIGELKKRVEYLEEKQKTIDEVKNDLRKAGEEILEKIKDRFENIEKNYLDIREKVGENARIMISDELKKFESKMNSEFSDAREEFHEISKRIESLEEFTDELSKLLTDIEMKIERERLK